MRLLIITQKVDANDQLLGFFIGWLERLAKKFEKLTVLCLEKGDYDLPQNTEVISLGKDRGASKLKQLLNFYSAVFSHRSNYDAVFVHMNPIWMVLGGLPWKILGKKRILWYTHKSVTFKLRLAEKFSDVILTASKESFRLPSEKVIVTGHGIDTELFRPTAITRSLSGGLKLLSVGRIAPVKNYGILIDAAKILADKGVDFNATLVGEPALESDKKYELNIKNKIKELKLDDRFDFAGRVAYKDLTQYYQTHDIFIHLSKTGSLDKTILEAMASGMKVLSSNDASRSFLPSDLIFSQDDSKELANKIELTAKHGRDDKLRQYVIENHGLNGLVDKIYNTGVSERITIYPFPYSSKSNKYIGLLYSNIDGKYYQDIRFEVTNGKSFFKLLFRKAGIIHIHWTNVVYGSKFMVKTVLLMVWNFMILLALKTKGYRIVWTMHNYYPHDSKRIWLEKLGQKIIFGLSNATTIHSKMEARDKKVIYIPHGNYIDAYGLPSNKRNEMRDKFGFQRDDIVLISVGAVKPYKKIENILTAFIKANAVGVKLLVAGKCDAGYAARLKSIAKNNDNIKFVCDFIPDADMPDYLAMADYSVFWYDDSVLTSGGIILSLSYGIPVIARNISASEPVKSGENGFLFSDERELAEIIKQLPDKPKFTREKVMNTVNSLSWERVSEELLKLYYSIWKN